MEINQHEFEELIKLALSSLPEKFRKKMENIAVVVEDLPSLELLREMNIASPYGLLGVYRGVPYTRRGIWYRNVLPDTIIIFKKPIEIRCKNKDEIRETIRKVVIHEIGHYFGLKEADLRRIEKEKNNSLNEQ